MARKKSSRRSGKAGRPKKKFPLDKAVTFMCRTKDWERYVQASDAEELELSAWIRRVLEQAAKECLGEG